jgi:hypothetical protein
MRRVAGLAGVLVVLVATIGAARASVIDFEGLGDLAPVTTQFPEVTFTNATVLTAGISLNEFEFPPHSGLKVVVDDGGPIGIVFDELQASVGGFVNYSVPVTLHAFDPADTLVGTATSAFASNLALSGDPGSAPNELLGVTFDGGIKRVTIEGAAGGFSFTVDDLTFGRVPEPATLLLTAGAIGAAFGWGYRRRCSVS